MARVAHRHVGKSREDGLHVVQERALGEVDAENLGQLIDDDHDADAGLESDQHRFGDEIGHEPKTQNRSEDQRRAHHQREQRSGLQHRCRIAIGHRDAELGADQDRNGCGRACADRTRRAEHGVDDERHERRVETDLNRQPGDGCVGHRLRNDDGGGGETRDDIEAQPFRAICRQPVEQRQSGGDFRHRLRLLVRTELRPDSCGGAIAPSRLTRSIARIRVGSPCSDRESIRNPMRRTR